jgi:putative hydrolase of the HAD superfamily
LRRDTQTPPPETERARARGSTSCRSRRPPKPNPKLFLRACTALGVRPSECIYVGDRPRMDIDPCNRIGMITVLNRRTTKTYAPGETQPDFEIHNFFDLLDILKNRFGVDVKH